MSDLAATDSGSDCRTETRSEDTGGDSKPGFVLAIQLAGGAIRDRPQLFLPFLFAGIVGAVSSLARIETPYPVGSKMPSLGDGSFYVPIPFVPRLEPGIELAPTILLGLRLEYAAVLAGWSIGIVLATALAFGVGLWLAAPETAGYRPPWRRLGWLAGYILAIQGALFGLLYVLRVPFRSGSGGSGIWTGALATLAALAVGGALLLAPASIVLGGLRPDRAVFESLAYAGTRPFSSAGLVLSLGLLAAVVSAVSTPVPDPTVALAVGTIASVTVAGTGHAAVVATTYDRWRR
ncbi:hypothetical protein [Halobiforma nitratireducens]|uniref:Uncharacterized protein n=1 Tax=Halobiforma nitratireducens JCM 10879 TaxID=1227454 RepID=M0M668_9EURY|nr:hypothetical protein [Halobiforma nitratireducens]EMA39870.1 hypothetical protein C446_08124 [Halobiforma nitratireducens JCM 10879]